ncbi:MAG: tRNA 2-thiocytidine biosynthesis TtcA family protein [Mycoplasmatales bacterium]
MSTSLLDNLNKYCNTVEVTKAMAPLEEIERSLIKKYRKELWTPFIKGIKEFNLISEGDKIAVCISGGKDSLLMAKLLQELKRHGQIKFELVFIAMNPGFNQSNYDLLVTNAKKLGIDLEVFDTEIFAIVDKIAKDYPCYLCAKMRRGSLYEFAQQKGCNKLALGHHFNDFIETTLLNLFYASNVQTMMPKLTATNYEGIELIRPLVYVKEEDIIRYTKSNGIAAMNCGCVVAAEKTSSKRREVKELIESLKVINPNIEKSIFGALKNVNLNTVLGYKINGKKYTFDDEFPLDK